MKTWTNPELEELEVELTAGGCNPRKNESWCNPTGKPNQSTPEGDPNEGELEIPEEGTPS